jgi:hypothetical protein
MSTFIRHLALVSESQVVSLADVMRVAAALQKQARRDIAPAWEVSATVDAFARLEDVPADYWPMIIQDDIGYAHAAGIHRDDQGQPFALITAHDDIDGWSLTASHETAEMLVDPFGDRVIAGDSLKPGQGRVNYLVEVADPSEAARFGYSVNGVLVSDFYTPRYFDPFKAAGVRCSFTGAITEPRQVLEGGYLSWHDPVGDHWWQQVWFDAQPAFVDLGVLTGHGSLRTKVDQATEGRMRAGTRGRASALLAGMPVQADNSGPARAGRLRAQIQGLVAARPRTE